MRILFHRANFDLLADCWQSAFPEKYWVDAELIRQNSVDCPVFDWGASFIEQSPLGVEGFVIVKNSASRLYKGPEKDVSHLSAIVSKEANIMVDLLEETKNLLRARGKSKLIFGQDSRHFFPGVPEECSKLSQFLQVEGFRPSNEQVDLENDLATFNYDKPLPTGYEFRPMRSGDEDALEEFFVRVFPGRWRYDVFAKLSVEGPQCVYITKKGDRIEGFALIQTSAQKMPIGGAVWKHDLGEHWGSLGPIGVSEDVRGTGVGGAIMGAALMHLKSLGVRRCTIDWTTLIDFYGKFGFEVSRRYMSCALPLE